MLTIVYKNQVTWSGWLIHFSDACKYLVDVLLPVNEVEREDVLDKIIDVIQKQPRKPSFHDFHL